MPYSNGQNDFDLGLLCDINIPTITNAPATATVEKVIRVPYACTVKRLDAVYQTEAGTTPALTVALRRSTTAVFTVTADTAATRVSDTDVVSGQNANLDEGEEVNIAFTSANADNDFTKLSVQVWVQRRND